jgi:hypothetical protein
MSALTLEEALEQRIHDDFDMATHEICATDKPTSLPHPIEIDVR